MSTTIAKLYREISNCLLCTSSRLQTVVPLEPIPLSTPIVALPDHLRSDPRIYDGVPLNLNLCLDCGQVQVSHRPDVEFEYRNYTYSTSLSAGLKAHYAEYARDVLTKYPQRKDGFVLEIGSNDGTLLQQFRDQGLRVLGIDPAIRAAQKATEKGVPTISEFFTESLAQKLRSEHGRASIMIANFVTANLVDMIDFAKGVRTILAGDGIAVFETQYGVDVVERNLLDTIYHEHISNFAVTPLRAHYGRHGLHLIDVKRVQSKGGSIRLTFTADAARAPSAAVEQIIAEEKAKGVVTPQFFADLPRWIARNREKILAVVDAEIAAGREVAGWGVSIGTSALLPQFGLTKKISYLFDDDLQKEPVMRGPDYQIPVLPGDQVYAKNPGAIVVFAWRYIAPIMAKHRRYLEQGGTFIVPLPEVSVVRGSDAKPPNSIGI